jgi:putative FmdB family regulatory protein
MPLFEYTCRRCSHRFEALVMGGRQPECPQCQSADLEKLYSTFGARSGTAAGTAAAPRFT